MDSDDCNYLSHEKKALSSLNLYFDPLSLWCPFYVNLKLCYSQIAACTGGWDDEVSDELRTEWNELMAEIQLLPFISFPRQYSGLNGGSFQLHLFCDASSHAMGACVYLRNVKGTLIGSALVMGKLRLFLQTQAIKFSIVRKELLALCMGADLLQQCKVHLTLPIHPTYMWVDSTTAIKCCQCNSRLMAQFVRNRADKVLKFSKGKFPGYIGTAENPANVASRGVKLKKNRDYDFWIHGSGFLIQPDKMWENGPDPKLNIDEAAIAAEMITSSARSNFIQIDGQNHVVSGLADSSSCMEAEKRLETLQKCFRALRYAGCKTFVHTSEAESFLIPARLL